jgi:hypothetical protein
MRGPVARFPHSRFCKRVAWWSDEAFLGAYCLLHTDFPLNSYRTMRGIWRIAEIGYGVRVRISSRHPWKLA